ncbi:MAG TPA: DUF748 domain-containing protein [Bacteroidales bacterium]|nr:DUF748 domain-containing protein [Bacteroidales bacterium]HPB25513.1 DUF748 domain-containing protein [Bacteroidales bacterium]HPI30203.1 DUF748 domain-containing protein [Bacteroidales bacterium]HQN16128.1 DUF748 domain-containing protein [Bacteroidales bacterium]HQP15605.1 DUF748 domain-containing protein [Bacteroidales bacterium]
MKQKFKIKKRYIILGSIALLIFLLLFFLSSIVKWYVVKNSEDLIGRKVDIAGLHINYFKWTVKIEDFTMYELNKKDTFVNFQELFVNFDPWNLLHKEIAFSEIRLDKPWVSIVYADSVFNFNDFLAPGDTTAADTIPEEESSDTLKYTVKNFSINGGYISYEDKSLDTKTELKNLGVKVPEISWNSKQSDLGVEFLLGEGGEVAVDGSLNQAAGKYSVSLKTNNIDITPFAGYTRPFLDANINSGQLYTNLKVDGELENFLNIVVTGEAGIKNLSVTELDNKPFCSFKDIYVRMDSLDIGKSNFCIDKVLLDEPNIVAVLERGNTNIQRILAPILNDTAASADTTTDTTVMHYSIDSLVIRGGNINFSDLTLNRPFNFDIQNLNVGLTGFSDQATGIPVDFSMNLNGPGTFKGKGTVDMVNTSNIIFKGTIANLNLVTFSPYSEYFLARPITRGTFNYDCTLKMTPNLLDNLNNLKLAQLEFGKKTKDTSAYKLPVALALYIIKDREGNIKIDLPVSGKPSDPSFKLRKIIWKTLEEFLLKAISEPFEAIGKLFGANPESIKQIPFEYLQDSLTENQRGKLDKIAEIIAKKSELSYTFVQTTDPGEEKAMIAVQEAKQLFVAKTVQPGTDPASIKIAASKVVDADPAFLLFVGIEGEDHGNLNSRCMQLVGSEKVEGLFNNLIQKRQDLIKGYLGTKELPQGSVAFKIADFSNMPEEMKSPKAIIELNVK